MTKALHFGIPVTNLQKFEILLTIRGGMVGKQCAYGLNGIIITKCQFTHTVSANDLGGY